jgi:hypothetical protein
MTKTVKSVPKKSMIMFAVAALLVAGILGGYGALPKAFAATAPTLGTAAPFAVLAYSGITNTGTTTITGNVGSYPTPAETGFGSVTITGTNYPSGAPSTTQTDLANAISVAMGNTPSQILTALDSQILIPGVYDSASTAFTLSGGVLTLNGQGNSASVWIFQAPAAIAGALTTTTGSSVVLENGADSCNVFWVTSAGGATIGTSNAFVGTIMAYSSVTLGTSTTLHGAALANTGDVTMDSNTISTACVIAPITTTSTSTTTASTSTSTTTASTSTSTTTASTTTSTATTANTGIPGPQCATGLYAGYYTNSTTHSVVNFANLSYAAALKLVTQNAPGASSCELASQVTTTTTSATTSTVSGQSCVYLTIQSQTANGTPLTGYFSDIWTNTASGPQSTSTGFTPTNFCVAAGTTATIGVFDYGCYTFDHWANTGSALRFRAFSITAATTFTAVYRDTCTPTPATSSTVSVNAIDASGNAVTGTYTTLWQNGVLLQSCFGPCTLTVSNGQSYQVMVSDFGSYAFSHWTDGTATRSYTVNVGSTSTTIHLTAVYT